MINQLVLAGAVVAQADGISAPKPKSEEKSTFTSLTLFDIDIYAIMGKLNVDSCDFLKMDPAKIALAIAEHLLEKKGGDEYKLLACEGKAAAAQALATKIGAEGKTVLQQLSWYNRAVGEYFCFAHNLGMTNGGWTPNSVTLKITAADISAALVEGGKAISANFTGLTVNNFSPRTISDLSRFLDGKDEHLSLIEVNVQASDFYRLPDNRKNNASYLVDLGPGLQGEVTSVAPGYLSGTMRLTVKFHITDKNALRSSPCSSEKAVSRNLVVKLKYNSPCGGYAHEILIPLLNIKNALTIKLVADKPVPVRKTVKKTTTKVDKVKVDKPKALPDCADYLPALQPAMKALGRCQ